MKKYFSLILIIFFGVIFASCGEKTFDQVPYEESSLTLQSLVLLYDDSITRTDNLSNLSLTKTITTTQTNQSIQKQTIKIGRHLQNPLVNITANGVNTIYYLNKQMVNGSTVTNMTETVDTLIASLKADYMKSISSTAIANKIYTKTFNNVTYYKIVFNTTYVNSNEELRAKYIENLDENYPDYIVNFSYEFGINKNSVLVMFKSSYTLQNHNRKNYFTKTEQSELLDYSSSMSVIENPSILNPIISG